MEKWTDFAVAWTGGGEICFDPLLSLKNPTIQFTIR